MSSVRLFLMVICFFTSASAYATNFSDNGNGTISDANTGFVWQKNNDGTARTWADALTYCEGLSLAGQADWRLPNKMELMSIVDYTRLDPAIDTTYFPNATSSHYWSSTSSMAGADLLAWNVYFLNGSVMHDGYKAAPDTLVRCVRGGQ